MKGAMEREADYAVGGYDLREPLVFETGIQSGDAPQEMYNRTDGPDLSEVRNHLWERLLQWYLHDIYHLHWEQEHRI